MEKIAHKYLKLYNDAEAVKYVYIYEDMNEYLNEQMAIYEKHLAKNGELNIFAYLGLIKNPYLTGLSIAFKQHDYELLNNSIYHYSKHRLLYLTGGGYDHCGYLWEVLDSMACNYKEAVERCFPESLGLSSNGYSFYIVAGNLLMSLWHRNERWMEVAYPAGEKFLMQKKGLWEKAIVAYFMALYKNDTKKATEELGNVCKYSTRLDRPKFYKCFCTEAHGLYNIARYILSADVFSRIELPTNDNFCKGLVLWQKERGYPEKGERIVNYIENLAVMNDILELPLPTCILTGKGKRKTVDVEQMRMNLSNAFARK